MTLHPEVILAAAGRSTRFAGEKNKLFAPLHHHFLLYCSLSFFESFSPVRSVVLVLSPERFEEEKKQVEALRMKKIKCIVKGGKKRQDSVYAGLQQVEQAYVLVHDAARPLLYTDEVSSLLRQLVSHPAVTLASPCRHTLARVHEERPPKNQKSLESHYSLQKHMSRKNIWELHTPQGFRASLLREAHERRLQTRKVFTDDATLVRELCDCEVKVLPARHFQFKVTYPEDLEVVKCLLTS